ncbi:MAG: Holliday junction branch migration protein RuvA [Phascolarctobacterium sp.]|nr:Holliday junction branch migration protein RuvA [Candidatus Phascolarctobacterium equi]
MIGMLVGKIEQRTTEYVIVMTAGGVGYLVFLPLNDLAEVAEGEPVKLWVHTSVREDAITLYGFLSESAYKLFEMLLTVKGVGPKIALGILSSTQPENFILAVQNKDLHYLTQLPGIGKKGAERMLLELKDKFGTVESNEWQPAVTKTVVAESNAVTEAMDALTSLGYARTEIMPVLRQIENVEQLASEEILRQALKLFARR